MAILFFSLVSNLDAFALKATSTKDKVYTEKTTPKKDPVIVKELDEDRIKVNPEKKNKNSHR